MLSGVMLSVAFSLYTVLNTITLTVVSLNVIMLSVVAPNVVMLTVIMLNADCRYA